MAGGQGDLMWALIFITIALGFSPKRLENFIMDKCPSLNDIMEIRCNKCTRSEQEYEF
jgi:hypothetical protein